MGNAEYMGVGSKLFSCINHCKTAKRKDMTSLTFLKYCSAGFGEDTPAQPGERYGVVKDLERTVKGYKRLRRELDRLKVVLEQQEDARKRSKTEKTPRTRYYKSQLGIRTAKSTGGTFFTFPVARTGRFVSK